MTKREIYKKLGQFTSKDMILINDEVIVKSIDLNDDWFELAEFGEDEEVGEDFTFKKVNHIDFKENYGKFETETHLYETQFLHPTGCVERFNVINEKAL